MFGIARSAFIFAVTGALVACGGQSDGASAPSGAAPGPAPVAQVDMARKRLKSQKLENLKA